jgi:hypothetical protein
VVELAGRAGPQVSMLGKTHKYVHRRTQLKGLGEMLLTILLRILLLTTGFLICLAVAQHLGWIMLR